MNMGISYTIDDATIINRIIASNIIDTKNFTIISHSIEETQIYVNNFTNVPTITVTIVNRVILEFCNNELHELIIIIEDVRSIKDTIRNATNKTSIYIDKMNYLKSFESK